MRLLKIKDFIKFMEWLEKCWLTSLIYDDTVSFEEYVADKLSISETEATVKITEFYTLYVK